MSLYSSQIRSSLDPEVLLKRYYSLEKISQKIRETIPGLHIRRRALLHCVESYFIDLKRLKQFHGIQRADRHKRGAFTMLWVVRTHPMQINAAVEVTKLHVMANEIFALHAGLAHLDLEPRNLSKNYIANLLYTLHYRQLVGEVLSSMMYLIEKAANRETP